MWLCLCSCGQTVITNAHNLKSGHTQSCGCLQKERTSITSKIHGKSKTRLYHIWSSMRERCNNPKQKYYEYYGGKGIKVCDEWQNYSVFEQWAFSNGYSPTARRYECTIDRINVNKGYSPDNCRFVSQTIQSNNASSNVLISYNGKTQTRAQWAKEIGVSPAVLRDRITRYNWSVERALITLLRG